MAQEILCGILTGRNLEETNDTSPTTLRRKRYAQDATAQLFLS